MLLQILAHTPTWVFVLFAVLAWFGAKQLRAGRVSLTRVMVMPVAMSALSVYGSISAFGDSPLAIVCWAAAAVACALLVRLRPLPATTRYDVATRSFDVAGSAVPLMLMMGIFFTKYIVGVQMAMHPALAHQAGFVLPVSLLYGAFSGIFSARALRMWTLAMRNDRAPGLGQTAI